MANRFYGYQYDTNPKKLNPENAPYNNRYPQGKKKNLSNLSIPEQRKKELEERQKKDRVNKKEYQENNKKNIQTKKVENKKIETKKIETKKTEIKKTETKKTEIKKTGNKKINNQNKKINKKETIKEKEENIVIKPVDKKETKAKVVAISCILTVFSVLFVISYQNSLISESFNIKEQYKKEYESLSKTNQQIEVGIQNNLNLNNIEKAANDRLGMQKLNNNQKIYVNLPKQDYIAPATEQIIENKETGFFEHFVNVIFNHSK